MGLLVLMEIALHLMETVMVLWVPTGISFLNHYAVSTKTQ